MNTILDVLYQFTQRDYIIFLSIMTFIPLLLFFVSKYFKLEYSKRDVFVSLLVFAFPILFLLFQVIWTQFGKAQSSISDSTLLQTGIFFVFLVLTYNLFANTKRIKIVIFAILLLLLSSPIIYLQYFTLFPLLSFAFSFVITSSLIAFFSKRANI